MSSHEANAYQNSEYTLELLRRFLDTHHLGVEQLAGLLRISPQTLEEWFDEGAAPPAAFLALAILFGHQKAAIARMSNG